eukprot:3186764-Pleurochrysis_carterae.AAC.1
MAYWNNLDPHSGRGKGSSSKVGSQDPSSSSYAGVQGSFDRPSPTRSLTFSRPQEGFVLPALSWVGRSRSRKHSVFDPVAANFQRAKVNSPSTIESRWAKMAMMEAWEMRETENGPRIVRIMADGQEALTDPARIVSHIKKRGASQSVAWSGAPFPIVQQMAKHANKSAQMIYQERESADLNSWRQLLNCPPGLNPSHRCFSQLDVVQKLHVSELRNSERHAQLCSMFVRASFQMARAAATSNATSAYFGQQTSQVAMQAAYSFQHPGAGFDVAATLAKAHAGAGEMLSIASCMQKSLETVMLEHEALVERHSSVLGLIGTSANPLQNQPDSMPAAAMAALAGVPLAMLEANT